MKFYGDITLYNTNIYVRNSDGTLPFSLRHMWPLAGGIDIFKTTAYDSATKQCKLNELKDPGRYYCGPANMSTSQYINKFVSQYTNSSNALANDLFLGSTSSDFNYIFDVIVSVVSNNYNDSASSEEYIKQNLYIYNDNKLTDYTLPLYALNFTRIIKKSGATYHYGQWQINVPMSMQYNSSTPATSKTMLPRIDIPHNVGASSPIAIKGPVNINKSAAATDDAILTVQSYISSPKFISDSDRRLKTNIQPYEMQASILDLPIYSYDYINGPKNQIGCMAQDLQKIEPSLVSYNENNYMTIQENKLIYLLIKEVQQLKQQLQQLQE